MVVAVYAPDSSKSLKMYEILHFECRLMCTDENDIEELMGIYGPLCWQGCDKDPGSFKKLMWYEIMEQFNCKASSTFYAWKRKRRCLYAQALKPREERGAFAAGLHHRTGEKR